VLSLVGTLATGQVGSLCQITLRLTVQHSVRFLLLSSFQYCFRKYNDARIVQKEIWNDKHCPVAIRSARIENRSIRSAARDPGIPFLSPRRYCSRAFEDDIRGISQNSKFSIEYKKSRQLCSGVFLLYGESEQGNRPKVFAALFLINGSLHKVKCSYIFHYISHWFLKIF
jgi:hypothetical protein